MFTAAAAVTLDDAGQVDGHLVLDFDPADVERLWQAPQQEVFFDVRAGRRRTSARQIIRVLV